MKDVNLPDGTRLPALGQGTWNMGDAPERRREEIAALRAGLDLGLTVIDTAEMYGDGASETLVGEAIAGRRDAAFIVTKALPQNASSQRLPRACEASLKRLKIEAIDLYLLHWRGPVPLEDTAAAMEALRGQGKIRHWGVSNLDLADMRELAGANGGGGVAADQILYNLTRRGPEYDLLPWLADHGIPAMAYSPVEQGRLLKHRGLADVARRHGATAAQVALAWVLRRDGVIAIPKAGSVAHVRENAAARDLQLAPEDLAALNAAFAPPRQAKPLEML